MTSRVSNAINRTAYFITNCIIITVCVVWSLSSHGSNLKRILSGWLFRVNNNASTSFNNILNTIITLNSVRLVLILRAKF